MFGMIWKTSRATFARVAAAAVKAKPTLSYAICIVFAGGHSVSRAIRSIADRAGSLAAALPAICALPALASAPLVDRVALYPDDRRRLMTSEDFRRYPGAGVLFCRDADGVAQKGAAAWLIGNRQLVLMNAHNFRDRRGAATRSIEDCFFQIGGRNYEFDVGHVQLGTAGGSTPLHITDDWALIWLKAPVAPNAQPQPVPRRVDLPTGPVVVKVTMVSPAGHANFAGTNSIETCEIRNIDPPTEDAIRRARHDCNDGFGGSGSGLFDEAGRLIALQSASLDMNRRIAFDVRLHYGSALLVEGDLRSAIARAVGKQP